MKTTHQQRMPHTTVTNRYPGENGSRDRNKFQLNQRSTPKPVKLWQSSQTRNIENKENREQGNTGQHPEMGANPVKLTIKRENLRGTRPLGSHHPRHHNSQTSQPIQTKNRRNPMTHCKVGSEGLRLKQQLLPIH